MASGPGLGCIENDPCFYPDDYAACGIGDALAGCPGYGPIVVGPAPNVPNDYAPPVDDDRWEGYELGSDVDLAAYTWTLTTDAEQGGGRIQYMAPVDDTNALRYGFSLPCSQAGSTGHRVYLWLRAKVAQAGTGLSVVPQWGNNAGRAIAFGGPTDRDGYRWARYNDALDTDRFADIDPSIDGEDTAVFIDGCRDNDEVCPNGTVAGLERVLVTADPEYRPPGSE